MDNNYMDRLKEIHSMLSEQQEEDEKILRVMEVVYIRKNGLDVGDDTSSLFPMDWFDKSNIELKIQVLNEAIENSKKIIDTKLYQNLIEGVKR